MLSTGASVVVVVVVSPGTPVVVVVEGGGTVQVALPVGSGGAPLLIAQVTVSTWPAW